jgi:hypothetical protein
MISPETKLLLFVPALILVPVVAVVAVVPGDLIRMLNLRATPKMEGANTVYRVKPLARALLLTVFLINFAWAWIEISVHGLGPWIQFAVLALFGVCFVLILMCHPSKISLEGKGIHCYRLLRRDVMIPWFDLGHVEKRNLPGNLTENSIYLFRSLSGTTIAVNDVVFDSEEILQRIRAQHPCPEKPYVRRRGYSPPG